MPSTPAFHSVNEAGKPTVNQVYHNNSECVPGREIPSNERRPGAGHYRLCDRCADLNRLGR
jgi:hypothetical protein